MRASAALRKRIAQLKALVLDCDGVLTDGRMYYGDSGVAFKAFDVKDGMGLARLRDEGYRLAIISTDRAPLLERRAEKLGIADVQQGVLDKAEALRAFARQYLLDPEEVGYMGDDVNDIDAINAAGVSFAPADATEPVRRLADWVSSRPGGRGAVREVADLLLECRRRK